MLGIILLVLFVAIACTEVEVKGPLTNYSAEALLKVTIPIWLFSLDKSLHRPVICVDYEVVVSVPSCHEEGEAFLIIEWEQERIIDSHLVWCLHFSHNLELVDQ